ncbi:MAG: hydrogenase maturation nickel metallochaperone HypA [Deltaproteobacteria bacterium]|jgi:hydrogenase nickel incorporation protein HypA/HybF|nr:hydrogenase maturation nickel metallochaperone HypA [Deltaproteobacteria bacterium]
MHELAIAENLLEMAGQELRRHGLRKLISLRVRCGALAGVLPEALEFAFSALAGDSGETFRDVRLEIVREPLLLRCAGCGRDFTTAPGSLFTSCPLCGYEFFHQALSGAEIFFERMEAE